MVQVAVLCVYVAECVLRKVLPTSNASCGGVHLKRFFALEKLLIIFLISPASETFMTGSFDDLLTTPMKPTHSSVLALWFTLTYSILLTLMLLEASILESPSNDTNDFRHSVLATLCFLFTLSSILFLIQFYNVMPIEMFSIVVVQSGHMLVKSFRIFLLAGCPKKFNAGLSRCLQISGFVFYTLESVLVVYFGFFIRGRVLAGIFTSQILVRSRQLVSAFRNEFVQS